MRKYLFRIVEPSNKRDASYYFDVAIIVLIVLSVIDIILESEKPLREKYGDYFHAFETFSVIIFTIEYFLRVWTCVEKAKYKGPFWGRVRFMLSPMAIIDLMAIVPFYLPFVGVDLRFLRAMRLFRVFLIFKLIRYTRAFNLIINVLKDKKEELMVSLVFLVITLVIISTLMYYVEGEAQPEAFSSISSALWWGVVTLTTVGYGDVYPVTTLGKLLNGMVTLLGIALIALPSGILASAYTEQMLRHKEEKRKKDEAKGQGKMQERP